MYILKEITADYRFKDTIFTTSKQYTHSHVHPCMKRPNSSRNIAKREKQLRRRNSLDGLYPAATATASNSMCHILSEPTCEIKILKQVVCIIPSLSFM